MRESTFNKPSVEENGFFVTDNNHTTQENTGGVWFFIAAMPKHQCKRGDT